MAANLLPMANSHTGPAACFVGLAVVAWALGLGVPPASAQAPASQESMGATMWVTTTQRLKTKVYASTSLSASPILVVVVHGDSPDGPPTYQYEFARTAAAVLPDTIVAAVLRPGYDDGEDRSDGMRGETTGDNYTPEVINAITKAISDLRARYKPRKVVLVGHSGGSAIVGSLIGQPGSIANAALLVSCVCDVHAWRKHMQALKGGRLWERPVRSLSPLALIDGISTATRVSLLVGGDDPTTPPDLTLNYANALRKHGVAVDVMVSPGLGHNILLEPIAMDRLKQIVSALGTSQ